MAAAPLLTTATAAISAEVRESYNRKLLKTAEPMLVCNQFFDKEPVPKGEGKTVNFNRVELLPPATTALTEGVTPDGSNISITRVPVTANQYGDFVPYSDRVLTQSIDPLLAAIVARQGEQAGRTIEWLQRDVMSTGTVVRYANGKTSRATVAAGDLISGLEIKKAVRTLKKNFAQRRSGGKFIAVISADTELDIMGLPEWIDTAKNSNTPALYNGEIGSLYGVRFVTSTEAKVFAGAGAGGIDVHSTVFFGSDAFGSTEITGLAMETINQPLGSGGATDPLNQRGSQGWKLTWGGKLLNDLFVCRLEHAVTG